MRVEEKISLTCGRDGGLQNMEVLGMITLRVSDEKNGRIRLKVNNNDKKGVQLQVSLFVCFLNVASLADYKKTPNNPNLKLF